MLEPAVVDMLRNPDRLAALDRTGVMDTAPEDAFDRLVRLSLLALDAPNGIVAFVDAERQFFKSRVGELGGPAPPRVLPLGWGFCPFTMATPRALRIRDARDDPVWANNPVVRRKGVVAYLGVPLIDHEGHILGTMCVLDHRPRAWTENQVEILTGLAACVMSEVHLRIEIEHNRELAEAAHQAADRERWRALQLHGLAEASLSIFSAPSVEMTLRVVTEQARGLIGAHQAATVVAPDGDWAHAATCRSISATSAASGARPTSPADRGGLYSLVREAGETVRLSGADLVGVDPAGAGHPARSVGGNPERRADGSWLAAPLANREGANLGVLELADSYRGEFSAEDETVLLQLAQMASVAVESSRLLEEQARLVEAFRASLVPAELPEVPGVAVAARYRPARHARVAGDFYDVFPLADGSWAVVLGDVCGKGPEAAAVAAAARHAVRGAAAGPHRPAEVLARLHETLLMMGDKDGDPSFCTLVYAIVHYRGKGVEVTLVCGGHPLPYLVGADGTVNPVGVPGTLLGAVEEVVFTEHTVSFPPGQTLVFYTDGLLDASVDNRPLDFGGIEHCLSTCVGHDAQQIASALLDSVAGGGVRQRDDLALLVLQRLASTSYFDLKKSAR